MAVGGNIGSGVPANLRGLLERLMSQTGNLGDRWRFQEARYPDESSPICLCIQYRNGSAWTTVAAFTPAGELT